jgi:hypothetical protein
MAKHGTLLVVVGATATYVLLTVTILALPPSIPQANIALVICGTIVFVLFLAGYFSVYYGWYNRRHRGKKEPSAIGKAINRSTQLKKITDKLEIHYRGIIDRMDQTWDYQPSDGEQIFKKGTSPGQTFPLRGLATSAQRPKNLEHDKAHLRSFENAWNFYSNGSATYTEYRQAEKEARNEIENYLINVEPALSHRLVESLTTMIMEKVQLTLRIAYQNVPRFEARLGQVGSQKMIFVDREMLDVIGEPNPWTLERGRRLASAMDKTVWNPHILYVIGQRQDTWNNLVKNRNDFLSAKDEIVRRARSVDCHLRELTDEGECDDCKPLKDSLKSLHGA